MSTVERVAIVTGAARGIGLATAELFLARGYRVSLLDIDAETLGATAARLKGPRVHAMVCDVSQPAAVDAAVADVVRAFGRIDVLVNNAGIALFSPILQMTFENWSKTLSTNLGGPFICTQACAPVMLKTGGGSIVNIASISAV